MMKKIIYILFVAFFVNPFFTSAQRKKETKERIKALKIAYLTEQLNLSEKEAEKFWPVYNKYDKKLHDLYHQQRFNLNKKIKKLGNLETISEKEAKEIAKNFVLIEEEILQTKKEMQSKLSKIITYKKIIQLKLAERSFHKKLLRRLRKK